MLRPDPYYQESKSVLLILVIIVLIFCGYIHLFVYNSFSYTDTIDSSYPCSSAVSAICNLGEELGYSIDKKQLIYDLNYFGSSPFISEEISKDALIKVARNQGIFLNGFKLGKDNLDKLIKIDGAFLVYLKDKGYIVVETVEKKSGSYKFRCVLLDGKIEYISQDEFLSLWDGGIFSLPLVGIMAKRLNVGSLDADSRFIAIYSYHSGEEDFEEFKKIVERLRIEAEENGQKLIYLDELGLIPEDSVIKKMKSEDMSKEEAFEDIRRSIIREDEMLEKGIPVHLPNSFYNDFFSYLAKHKIKSIAENLDYDLWKIIVRFDDFKLHDKAMGFFVARNFAAYTDTMKEYTQGFWKYNVKKRDLLFKKQVEEIMKKYPDTLIFTLRGIGHYGMEESISIDNFSVGTYVFAEGMFFDNLISSQDLYVLWSNGVNVNTYRQEIMLLKSFIQEAIRSHLKDKGMGIAGATRVSVDMTKNLDKEDIMKLSAQMQKATLLRRLKKSEDIWKFIYNWVNNTIDSDEDLKDIYQISYR